jgi:hypothetical protein
MNHRLHERPFAEKRSPREFDNVVHAEQLSFAIGRLR